MRRLRRAGVGLAAALLPACALAAPAVAERERSPGPPVEARAWTLVDARTGEVIVAHRSRRRLPIASATKLMTAWVTLKEAPLDKVVRAQPYKAEYGESLMGLRRGRGSASATSSTA